MNLTREQEQVLNLIKKHHPEYRDWYEGNILDLQEAKDILSIIDSLQAENTRFEEVLSDFTRARRLDSYICPLCAEAVKDGYYNSAKKALTEVAALKKENEHLKKFLEWLFTEVFEGSPDGGDIQDKADEMGILKLCKVDPKDPQFEEQCNDYDTDELYFWYWHEQALKSEGRK